MDLKQIIAAASKMFPSADLQGAATKAEQAISGNTVNITGAGYYDVDASVTVAIAAAGTVTATLFKDGVAVPGATASASGAAGAPVVLAFPALVRQACCASGAALTLVLTGAAATVNNVAMRVQRI